MDTHVNRIRLPRSDVPPHFLAFQYEDALRTNIDDHGKLVVIRQLRIGPPSARTGAAPPVARAWQDVCNTLCHGVSAGAGEQNAIWFRDREEAILLLLEWRLRGRDVSAWFWRLAVPEGVALPVVAWVERIVRLYYQQNSTAAAVRLLAVVAGYADASVRAQIVEKLWADIPVQLQLPSRGEHAQNSATPDMPASEQDASDDVLSNDTPFTEQADILFVQLPAALRRILQSLARSSDHNAFAAEICAALVLANIPAWHSSYEHRAMLAASMLRRLRSELPLPLQPVAEVRPVARTDAIQPRATEAVDSETLSLPKRDGKLNVAQMVPPVIKPVIANQVPEEAVAQVQPLFQPAPTHLGEMATGAAGLYLTLLPLWHLDWPGFLARNRQWIEHKPTAQLLAFIAQHHRLGNDPLGRYWTEQSAAQTVAIPIKTLAMWRIALDRWLRRRAKLCLASLVARRGWVDLHHETVRVRFPADAADIRLRRLALDRDPGWLDWLGQSVRYIYSDQPPEFGMVLS